MTSQCGAICCSIITGRFALGCAPIITPFSLSIGCIPAPTPPTPGGGGGGPYPQSSTINYHTPRTRSSKTIMITVNIDDQKWNKNYMLMNKPGDVKVAFESITNISSRINIQIEAIHKPIKIVTATFNSDL